MDKLSFEAGGFPMSVERLAAMQECWAGMSGALHRILGTTDSVISGCGNRGESDGWIFLDGQILEHRKSDIASGGEWACVMEETVESVAYEDGVERAYRTRRYAKSYATKPSEALYAQRWASIQTVWDIYRLTTQKAGIGDIETAKSRISQLEQKIAALDTSTSADLSALTRQLVPKGTIIMWGGALPLTATTKQSVVDGMGAAYGYIPCLDSPYGTTAARTAWNAYFEDIGLPDRARWNASATSGMPFTTILKQIGLPAVNLYGRFPLGTGTNFSLGATGGEEKHTLTESEMPRHTHTERASGSWKAYGGGGTWGHALQDGDDVDTKSKTGTAGGGLSHNNMPPYYALNFLIKAI